ncbi:MAG TPA: hypothetical protein PLB02_14845, partial [Thermoanaerobaculia bacterium]|nr:hypothetical protein [Thermoanaerobaculia bacterium]
MTARARLLSVTFLVAGCTAAPPPRSAAVDRIETRARLLRAEDTRSWDPDTFGLASGSPDPEVR